MRHTTRTITVLICAASVPALAIPTQPIIAHSDAAADISYIQDKNKPPEQTNHFHVPLRAGETLTANADGITSNKGWSAFYAWDNRNYRFVDNDPIDGKNKNADHFGHGYIDPAEPLRYTYEDNVPADAKPLLAEAFTKWNDAAKAVTKDLKSPGGSDLKTSIAADAIRDGDKPDITYRFVGSLQGPPFNANAAWAHSAGAVDGKFIQSQRTLVFDDKPGAGVNAPQGFTIKEKGAVGAATNSFGLTVNWSFDKKPDLVKEVDLIYIRTADGEIFDDLTTLMPGATMKTDTFGTIPAGDKVKFYQFDFFTIALHETGHILGLHHAPGNPDGNLMRAELAREASFGNTLQTIDADSAFAAAMLYTVAIPEPSQVLAFATLPALSIRRRARRAGSSLPPFRRHPYTPRFRIDP